MEPFPQNLARKLAKRQADNALRQLGKTNGLVDFSSNDYLGLARNEGVYAWASQLVADRDMVRNGSTGSRLLTGNHCLYEILEDLLQRLHDGCALVFNSGYDANIGFFSTVPQKGDIVFYDELAHASIRDGIRLGLAKSYKFRHNNLDHLKELLARQASAAVECYVVSETVFSMDGDSPNLEALVELCEEYHCRLVVDEAHAAGVMAHGGSGMLQHLGLHQGAFVRIITFGKALGAHGAAIVCGAQLKQYLLNFTRSFVYTTGLSPHSVATLLAAHHFIATGSGEQKQRELRERIDFFRDTVSDLGLEAKFKESHSAIQCFLLEGNTAVKAASAHLKRCGFDVRPILSPTVREGCERLRFCLHSFNTNAEIREVLGELSLYLSAL